MLRSAKGDSEGVCGFVSGTGSHRKRRCLCTDWVPSYRSGFARRKVERRSGWRSPRMQSSLGRVPAIPWRTPRTALRRPRLSVRVDLRAGSWRSCPNTCVKRSADCYARDAPHMSGQSLVAMSPGSLQGGLAARRSRRSERVRMPRFRSSVSMFIHCLAPSPPEGPSHRPRTSRSPQGSHRSRHRPAG